MTQPPPVSPAGSPQSAGYEKVVAPPAPLGAPGSVLRLIGNILWLILGGLEIAIAYALAGLVMFVTIIGIPFGIQAFKLAGFSLWPFGRMMIKKAGAGAGSALGNVLWFIFAGWWLALAHLLAALLYAITIIGIPFAVASVRLAGAALIPFGREVVPYAEARMRTP